MIEFITNYGLFLAKTVTLVVSVLFVFIVILSSLMKGKSEQKDQIEIKYINEKYKSYADLLELKILSKSEIKEKKKRQKQTKKEKKKQLNLKKRIFVLDFDGDIRASAVESLREEISAVLTIATVEDEILVCLDSGGGMVHMYGLASSQLQRIKDKGIPLTIAIDKIAASGGYLMACVADRIIAAPFAIIGSIGVIAQIPNFNRFLKKHDIDYEQITAGKHKRTLTMFGENTDSEREKLKEELEETHELFKGFVLQSRKELDIDKLSTGEHWYGSQAIELKLVDELLTSDDYLMSKRDAFDLYQVTYVIKKSLTERLPFMALSRLKNFYLPFFSR